MSRNRNNRNNGDDERLGASPGGAVPANAGDAATEGSGYGEPLISLGADNADEAIEVVAGDHQYARHNEDPEREMQDREHAERDFSDSERLEMFRLSMFQNQLPTLPPMSGFHLCWLTTQNPRDSIQGRLRLGYQLLKQEELPGWEANFITSGAYAGCVGVNEMVAAKLPMQLYELYMTEAHHNQPLAEEGRLRSTLDAIREEAVGHKAKLLEEDGTAQLGRQSRRARFEEVHGPRRSVLGDH